MTREYPAPAIPERYAQALGGHDPIESMRKAPKRLKKLLKGLSKKQLRRAPEPGKWSVHQVVAHLCDGEMVLGTRMRFVAAMERPPIHGYDQDAFVANLRYDEAATDELLEGFAALRALNVALLERLPDEAFARVGLHSERGEESLSTMLHMYAGHDRVHEQQIEAFGARLAGKRAGAAATESQSKPKSKSKSKSKRGQSKRK